MLIIISNSRQSKAKSSRPRGSLLAASIDIEWTKNYKLHNANVPFCWSVTWLQIPDSGFSPLPPGFTFTSVYVTDRDETQELVVRADTEIAAVLGNADFVVGHQLSSDLAVLRNASTCRLPAVEELRARWHSRRQRLRGPFIIDTRYDADKILSGKSRRLVDVCAELCLDVTQPELKRTSMTALHHRWLDRGDPSDRERITVLNLRHGLSASYVALLSTGLGVWAGSVNVNQVLDRQLNGKLGWLATPEFRQLLL
jgi:hypothetical protein